MATISRRLRRAICFLYDIFADIAASLHAYFPTSRLVLQDNHPQTPA
jgi:hypothetical protein